MKKSYVMNFQERLEYFDLQRKTIQQEESLIIILLTRNL